MKRISMNGIPMDYFSICSVCGEVKMRRKFDSGFWFDHKGGQLHNQKKHNAISEKARLDKSVKAGTKHPTTNQSSIISIVIHNKRNKDDSPANAASLQKEN